MFTCDVRPDIHNVSASSSSCSCCEYQHVGVKRDKYSLNNVHT